MEKLSQYDYCVGCGLCRLDEETQLITDQKGFYHPRKIDKKWVEEVCPNSGKQIEDFDLTEIFGRKKRIYYGWAQDDVLRRKASSGGVLTSVAAYMLDNGIVDGVIHTCKNNNNPTETVTCISYNSQELCDRVGSRYSISHPLERLDKLNNDKKYLFIGKPCDVTALRNYTKINPSISEQIPYMFSFFCAGLPSVDAQEELLKRLEVNSECVDLNYRGNGWPGMVTAIDKEGNSYFMDYENAWGNILGRDIMRMCKICADGIGESADLSCGDWWFLNDVGEPDFTEHDGRNVIFCRTDKGLEILKAAKDNKYIVVYDNVKEKDIFKIQKYQYIRRGTLFIKIITLKLLRMPTPKYDLKKILKYSKNTSIVLQIRTFFGLIKRVKKGRF